MSLTENQTQELQAFIVNSEKAAWEQLISEAKENNKSIAYENAQPVDMPTRKEVLRLEAKNNANSYHVDHEFIAFVSAVNALLFLGIAFYVWSDTHFGAIAAGIFAALAAVMTPVVLKPRRAIVKSYKSGQWQKDYLQSQVKPLVRPGRVSYNAVLEETHLHANGQIRITKTVPGPGGSSQTFSTTLALSEDGTLADSMQYLQEVMTLVKAQEAKENEPLEFLLKEEGLDDASLQDTMMKMVEAASQIREQNVANKDAFAKLNEMAKEVVRQPHGKHEASAEQEMAA